jgi:hypothetical protein
MSMIEMMIVANLSELRKKKKSVSMLLFNFNFFTQKVQIKEKQFII